MISAFGVEHGDEFSKREKDPKRGGKAFGSAGKTAAVVGGAGALLIGRGRANKIGAGIAQRMVGRAHWSAGRAAEMPKGKLANARYTYARKLEDIANKGPAKNQDVREWAGRAAVGGGAGGVAGGVVYGRKKLSAKEGQ